MRFRSFIIAYAVVLAALLLFADRRPAPRSQSRYSEVVDLTGTAPLKTGSEASSGTRIIPPAAFIPGTWGSGQIPAERLIAPLVVMDLNAGSAQVSVNDIANWEALHGNVPQGAIVAVRRGGSLPRSTYDQFPVSTDAAQFLMDARYTTAFLLETPVYFGSDRTLCRQIALHGNYVVEQSARLAALPATGSLVIVAPEKNRNAAESPVRVLAMVSRAASGS
jgi:kynurenine formamidase